MIDSFDAPGLDKKTTGRRLQLLTGPGGEEGGVEAPLPSGVSRNVEAPLPSGTPRNVGAPLPSGVSRGRGEASVEPLVNGFHDPIAPERLAQEHKIAIAAVLVGARELPLSLPKFGLRFMDVEADAKSISLVLGNEQMALAEVRIESNGKGDDAAFNVKVRETQPLAVRHRAATTLIRDRLAIAVTPEKWRVARKSADAMLALPTGVPLSHFRQLVEGISPPMGLVRTGFRCNQDCGFCWQSRDWPGYSAAQVHTWITDIFNLGGRSLTISGGEPTLDRHLAEHIRHANALGMSSIVIETNAIQIGKRPEMAIELRDAGLTRAFVSLHSADAAVSDIATRAPGTHAKTVAGIRALLDAQVHVILNAVILRDTVAGLSEFPRFVRNTFGKNGWLGGVSISVPVLPWDYTLTPHILAEPEDVRAALAKTIDAAEKEGILIFGIDGPCGPPLCAFGADRRVTDLSPKGPVSFRTYVPECEKCKVRGSCHGVQPDEVARFGSRAVLPIVY